MHLQHPHIISFKGVFLTNKHLALVMELAEGGNMLQYLNRMKGLPEDEARWIF